MIDPASRRKAAFLLKTTPGSPEDVRELVKFLEEFLQQSPSWTEEDSLLEVRTILCSLSVHIWKSAKSVGIDILGERTPTVRAWFNYGGSRDYLNNRKEPLDLAAFRTAMGDTIRGKQPAHNAEGGTRTGEGRVSPNPRAKGKEKEAFLVDGGSTNVAGGGRSAVEEVGKGPAKDIGDSLKSNNVREAGEMTNAGPKPQKKPKKRKSPATVNTSGEEDAVQQSNPPKRSKQAGPEGQTLYRYDPPCTRCADRNEDCFYTRFNNACTRCKPSKLKCSHAKGSRKDGDPANPIETSTAADSSSKPHQGSSLVDRTHRNIVTNRTPKEGHPHPPKTASKPKPSNMKAAPTKENPSHSGGASAKRGLPQRTNQPPQVTDANAVAESSSSNAPSRTHLKSRRVDSLSVRELTNDLPETLAQVRERQYAFEHRLADAEARASTALRELRWYQGEMASLDRLRSAARWAESHIEGIEQQQADTHADVSRLEDQIKTSKNSILERLNNLEGEKGTSANVEELQGRFSRTFEERIRTSAADTELREQKLKGQVESVERRVKETEGSAELMKRRAEEISEKYKDMEERLSKAEGDVRKTGPLVSAIEEVKTLIVDDRERRMEVVDRIGGIEVSVAKIVGEVEGLRNGQTDDINASSDGTARIIQGQLGDINRRLGHIETDVRHAKSALDLNALNLTNVLRTVMHGVREEGMKSREEMRTQLSNIRQDINTQLNAFTKLGLAQLVWNGGLHSGPGFGCTTDGSANLLEGHSGGMGISHQLQSAGMEQQGLGVGPTNGMGGMSAGMGQQVVNLGQGTSAGMGQQVLGLHPGTSAGMGQQGMGFGMGSIPDENHGTNGTWDQDNSTFNPNDPMYMGEFDYSNIPPIPGEMLGNLPPPLLVGESGMGVGYASNPNVPLATQHPSRDPGPSTGRVSERATLPSTTQAPNGSPTDTPIKRTSSEVRSISMRTRPNRQATRKNWSGKGPKPRGKAEVRTESQPEPENGHPGRDSGATAANGNEGQASTKSRTADEEKEDEDSATPPPDQSVIADFQSMRGSTVSDPAGPSTFSDVSYSVNRPFFSTDNSPLTTPPSESGNASTPSNPDNL